MSSAVAAMLLTESRFKDFINGEIADPATTEVLTALSAASRQEIDETVARALAAGATECKPVMEMDSMYAHSFQDLDGHVWELVYMQQPAQ